MLKRLGTLFSLLIFVFVSGWQLVQAEPMVVAKQQKTVTDTVVLVGNIEAVSPDRIILEGETILLSDSTVIEGDLEVGAFALVEADEVNGVLTAVYLFIFDDGFEQPISLVGEVTALDNTSITVDGQLFIINDETFIVGELALGEFVYLEAVESNTGSFVATYIEVLEDDGGLGDTIEWVGFVDSLSEEEIVVSGLSFTISDTTVISGELTLGAFVFVEAEATDPINRTFTATYIEVLDNTGQEPTFEWFGIVESLTNTELVVDGLTFAITSDTVIEGKLAIGEFVFISALDNGDSTYTAQVIEVLEDDGGWGDIFEWFGTVEAYDGSELTVDRFVFAITPDTEIIGEIAVGEFVFVLAEEDPATGTLTALLVEVLEDDGFNGLSYIGIINEYQEGVSIVLDELTFLITDTTQISGEVVIGSPAFVYAEENENGDYVALTIEVWTNTGGGEFFWAGDIEAVGQSEVIIAGLTFLMDDATVIEGELAVGEFALVAALEDGGQFTAQLIIVLESDISNEIVVVGEVTAYTNNSITVDNDTFAINDRTEIVGNIAVGEEVYLVAEASSPNELPTAVYIEVLDQTPPMFTYAGFVTAVTTDTVAVDDLAFTLTDETEITGELTVGAFVFVLADIADDGSYIATYIEVLDDGNWSDIIDVVGEVTDLTADGLTLDGDWFFFINDETEIEGELAIGAEVYISAEYDRTTDTYTALYIEVLGDDGNQNEPVVLLGVVEAYTNTELIVDGTPLLISDTTQIVGELAVGEFVFVVAFPNLDTGELVAFYIEVLDDDGNPVSQGAVIGEVTAVSDDSLTVVDIAMNVVSETVIMGDIEVGTLVYAEYEVQSDGSRVALFVESLEEASATGTVESMSANEMVVDGQTFRLDGRAQVEGRVTLGTEVYVGATQDQGGNRTARLIRALDTTGGYTIYLPIISKN